MSDQISNRKVFHLEPQGLLANRMIEYMVALNFCRNVPNCQISNVNMPEWHINHPSIRPEGKVIQEGQEHLINIMDLASKMQSGIIDRVEYSGYGQRMENLADRDFYKNTFNSCCSHKLGFDDRYLVCHVRAGEVLDGSAPNYPLTPVEFFQDLVNETKLEPVFIGQTEPNKYTNRLRAAFPSAEFRKPQNIVDDFETIRQSKNVVVGVSTFAWLAAWLSEAEKIFMAVSGLFNPRQYRHVHLLPLNDQRYRFYLFPINYGVHVDKHESVHAKIYPFYRYLSASMLEELLTKAPRFNRSLAMMKEHFDPSFYLKSNADVSAGGDHQSHELAHHHYDNWGYAEFRPPFELDHAWYAETYPIAAFEVAQGDFTDFTHHFVAVGKSRGYKKRAFD